MGDVCEYDKKIQEIRSENKLILSNFKDWLSNKNLSDQTIKKHIDNIDFYINHYLNYYEPTNACKGIHFVEQFLGDWFIHKTSWSNKASILSNIASLRKFYQYMLDIKKIDREDLKSLNTTIRKNKECWIETVEIYKDF